MRSIIPAVGIALLLAAAPAAAQDWEAMMDHAREALEQTHVELEGAMDQLAEVEGPELRELSERIIAELNERLEHVHQWSMELAEQMAQRHREETEQRAHEEGRRHEGRPEGPEMLGRTIRLTFEAPCGPVSILTATREFEAGATHHEQESNHREGNEHAEHGGEGGFEVGGEIMPMDDEGHYLVRFSGHCNQEERGEEMVERGAASSDRVNGGNVHFHGSAIMGLHDSKLIFSSPRAEIHLVLEES